MIYALKGRFRGGDDMKLYIKTLGEFDIKADEQSILADSSRTYKINRLFEYFLTFRNKRLLPETIIDNIFADSESDDPKNVLRTQIFRLRKIINSINPKDSDLGKYLNMNFVNGYYCLETGENVIIDIEEFENLINAGDKENNLKASADFYQKAIDLYKGPYLSGNAYEVWLVPTRNYYHRLFIKTLFKHIELLKKSEEHERIVSLCEKTLLVEPFEESIHIELMEALLRLGQNKPAMNHYEYAYNLLEKEFDAKPSRRFTDYLTKIQNNSIVGSYADTADIKKDLKGDDFSSAMYCSFENFKSIFNVQKRKSLRSNQNDYLCILSIKNESNDIDKQNKIMRDIFLALGSNLRKGDVFTSWNNHQILIMIYDVQEKNIPCINDRIIKNIKEYTRIKENEIGLTFQPVYSQNGEGFESFVTDENSVM